MTVAANFPAAVRAIRAMHGLSQRELAAACGHMQSWCSRVEERKREASLRDLELLSEPGGSGGDIGGSAAYYGAYEAVLCTQVLQYVDEPGDMLGWLRSRVNDGGALILTGPTCWIEPPGHLHSYTCEGIRRLLVQAGFTVERLESRGHVGPGFSIGYGVLARA